MVTLVWPHRLTPFLVRVAVAVLVGCGGVIVAGALLVGLSAKISGAEREPRVRMLLGGEYWSMEPVKQQQEYLNYLARVKPDVIHAGVLGPQLASTVSSRGKLRAYSSGIYPTDVATIREYLDWWRPFVRSIRAHGVKVQAISSMTYAWGDHEKNTGFFKYYGDLWEEELLGPRPHPHAAGLMQHNRHGEMLRDAAGNLFKYRGCVNNPYWRQLLKALVRAGVETGFDGFMVQFPYSQGPCACQFCQQRFRVFLERKYAPEVLARRFAIHDLDEYVFDVVTGPRERIPAQLDLEAHEFGAVSVKECFDDVFVRYGRSLKPDLVVSMWTHFRQFLVETADNTSFSSFVSERALLPVELWGKGESYTWHCSPMTASSLEDGIVGDQTLEWKYTRAMAGPVPALIQKYDSLRWRLTAAEALALGGIVFGVWRGPTLEGQDREPFHLASYSDFIHAADAYLFPRESYAEAALLFPRTALYSGDATFLEPLRRLGRGLIAKHVLFDLLIDQKMSAAALARHRCVLIPTTTKNYLSSNQERMLDEYRAAGGAVLVLPTGPPPEKEAPPPTDGRGRRIFWGDLKDTHAVAKAVREAARGALSEFDAPSTVQVHAERQPDRGRMVLHLVNYNRNEEAAQREAAIAVDTVGIDLSLPAGPRVTDVRFLTPGVHGEARVEFTQSEGRLRLHSPSFLVYGLVVVELKDG